MFFFRFLFVLYLFIPSLAIPASGHDTYNYFESSLLPYTVSSPCFAFFSMLYSIVPFSIFHSFIHRLLLSLFLVFISVPFTLVPFTLTASLCLFFLLPAPPSFLSFLVCFRMSVFLVSIFLTFQPTLFLTSLVSSFLCVALPCFLPNFHSFPFLLCSHFSSLCPSSFSNQVTEPVSVGVTL